MNLTLSVVVFYLMRHVETLLNSDARINLMEVVTQNKDAITSRLKLNINFLEMVANRATETLRIQNPQSEQDLQRLLEGFARENERDGVLITNSNGDIFMSDGREISVSGRTYFRIAIEGIPNISERMLSRINGEEVCVISVPIYYDGTIIGTVLRVTTIAQMREICALSLYSSKGYMYVLNSDGYVVLHSDHENCQRKSDNFFRDLYASGNQAASMQLEDDIRNNRTGFVETAMGGEKYFSAYTPINNIHDWHLITSVPVNVVSSNSNTVIRLFYIVLLVLVLIFTTSLSFFLWYKNNQRLNLEKIAFVDPVIQGNNHAKFVVEAQKVLDSPGETKLCIMVIDIDNFKYINNFYGFEYGDSLLRKIYTSLEAQTGPHEIVARVNADHFVLLLENTGEERINTLFASLQVEEVPLYFSAGVYPVTSKGESLNLMVDKAGIAARSVKGVLHRKIAYYSEKFEQSSIHREQLKRSLLLAIENDEFIPFYQPKANIHTGEVVGGEALARWKRADGSFVYPSEFIPLSEQTGLIVDIDMIIYEKVLKFQRGMLDMGKTPVPVSVNFSRLHLSDRGFLDKIVKKLHLYGIPAGLIEIELTESAIFDNFDIIYQVTKAMHDEGFLIAMDDFGSGYSSLNMLKDIPIDILKLDKGFLDDAMSNSRRDIIFSCIAEMARQLNIHVVVEGVETLENVQLMTRCGCTIAQGYYFAKPMEEGAFERILENHQSLLPVEPVTGATYSV